MRTSMTGFLAFAQAMIIVALVSAVVPSAAADAGGCLIISELALGNESGESPRWLEITNTSTSDYTFAQGGIIVQSDGSDDVVVDIDLTGITIAPGQAFTICSNVEGGCMAFQAVYSQPPDLCIDGSLPIGDGDDRYILTDAADGSNLLDIYGEFGVDGTGEPWEYTLGYSYRLPAYNSGSGGTFAPDEWFYGGVDSLKGDAQHPSWEYMLMYTDPGRHSYDEDCTACPGDLDGDNDVDLSDLAQLLGNYGMTSGATYEDGDLDGDGDVDLADLAALLGVYGTTC
jgi:hypothetical protein